jgi:hypothetical protein
VAKRHKGPEVAPPTERTKEAPQADVDLDMIRQAVSGNAAFQETLGADKATGLGEGFLALAAGEIGQSVAASPVVAGVLNALRDVPRDADVHARLLEILQRSALDRRDELMERLEQGQQRSLLATSILEQGLGPLDEAARSEWVAAFEGADAQLDVDASHDDIAKAVSGGPNVAEMCAAILRSHRLEEEEDEVSGMDYATEESGL